MLFNSADLHTFAPEEKIKYHNDMTTERDIRNQIKYAHDEGIAEGKAETAAELKRLGIDHDVICKSTGLTEEQLAKL